jgi:hypothetical protein
MGHPPAGGGLTGARPRVTNDPAVGMTLNLAQTDWPGRAGFEGNLSRVSGSYHARFLGGKDS